MIVYFDVFSVLVFLDETIFLELAVAFVSRLTCCRQQRNINGYLRGYQARSTCRKPQVCKGQQPTNISQRRSCWKLHQLGLFQLFQPDDRSMITSCWLQRPVFSPLCRRSIEIYVAKVMNFCGLLGLSLSGEWETLPSQEMDERWKLLVILPSGVDVCPKFGGLVALMLV